ncbi:MAG: TIGR02587 family membrane protein [Alphaproteobacteria bacterium]|nr:TIGR02587 family membrane protein [Alphaproteobacteria bacterium]MBU2380790.1 TIGR02587 family membrane protein [Alphaproteobacteria bacterium]
MTAARAPSALIDAIDPSRERAYARDLARAFGGALLFTIPLLMTMEMWAAGYVMDGVRLLAFLLAALPLLFFLSHYAGFRRQRSWADDLSDTLVALAVGFIVAGVFLTLLGVIESGDGARRSLAQIALQAVPGAIGALLARRQLSADGGETGREDQASYAGELFLMVVGALFLALNMAPTEEMILIAFRATPWHVLALIVVTLTLMHGLVYSAGFAGQEEHDKPVTAFFHYTLAGYGLVLVTGLFVLWVFGRTAGQSPGELAAAVVVLGLPGGLGAAAARLLV